MKSSRRPLLLSVGLLFVAYVGINLFEASRTSVEDVPLKSAVLSKKATLDLADLVTKATARDDVPEGIEKRYRRCFRKGRVFIVDKAPSKETHLEEIRKTLGSQPEASDNEAGTWEENGSQFTQKGSLTSPVWRFLAEETGKPLDVETQLSQMHPESWLLLELYLSC